MGPAAGGHPERRTIACLRVIPASAHAGPHLNGSVAALAPALGLLLTGVPLAVLLDRVGFFDAAATVVSARRASALGLWLLAAATTARPRSRPAARVKLTATSP